MKYKTGFSWTLICLIIALSVAAQTFAPQFDLKFSAISPVNLKTADLWEDKTTGFQKQGRLDTLPEDYIPFPDSIAAWGGAFSYILGSGKGDSGASGYTYRLEGDTVLNDTLYSLLYIRDSWNWSSFPWGGYNNLDDPFGLIGGVREDASAKVWFRSVTADNEWTESSAFNVAFDGTSEYLMYDFNMAVGDSIQAYLEYGGAPEWLVLDEIYVDLLNRRNFRLEPSSSPWGPLIWIEGLGSLTGGPLSIYQVNYAGEGGNDLYCFSVFDELVYSNLDLSSDCNQITVSLSEFEKGAINLFPNPMTQTAVLDVGDLNGPFRMEVFDLNGKLLHSEQQASNNKQLQIFRGGLSTGQYILRISSDKEHFELPFAVE
jgi:hypothetical protein